MTVFKTHQIIRQAIQRRALQMFHPVNDVIQNPIAISGGAFYLAFFQELSHRDAQSGGELANRVFRW